MFRKDKYLFLPIIYIVSLSSC